MPKPASTRPAYKMLTCIYLCRTLLFFAPYADFLFKKTSGVLIGEVHTCEPNDYLLYHALKCPSVSNPDLNKPIGHVLYIRAPFFNDYRFEILSITHYLLNMYPLQLNNVLNNCYYTIDSEEYLMKKLSEIFASKDVLSILNSLLIQSK